MNNKKKFLYIQRANKANLPPGFAELEYLESSGTQWIDSGLKGDNTSVIRCSFLVFGYGTNGFRTYGCVDVQNNLSFYSSGAGGNLRFGNTTQIRIVPSAEDIEVVQSAAGVSINGVFQAYEETPPFETPSSLLICNTAALSAGSPLVGRFYSFKHLKNGVVEQDLIPVIRESDSEPGFWDKLGRRFLPNVGSGTFGYKVKRTGETVAPMSLRDPYYVAPSGVYARLVAKNELDIIADTDIEADVAEQYGYTWFANTAAAYEHFGIVSEAEQMTV